MGIQPTASRTDLLLACQRPFASEVEPDERVVGEAAVYGTVWHECMYARLVLNKRSPSLEASVDGLAAHLDLAEGVLKQWLLGDNPWHERLLVCSGERSIATRIRRRAGKSAIVNRITTLERESHTYDLHAGEIGGTYDLLVEGPARRRIVIDYKTGDYGAFHTPAALGQIRTLALQTSAAAVAILHAPRDLPATVYTEDLQTIDRKKHARALRLAVAKIDDGSLRPGPHCTYCPARQSCPANDSALLKSATSLVRKTIGQADLVQEIDLGKLHMMLGELDRLAKRARAEIRSRVEAGELIERPDGKTLTMVERSYERLSKTSILQALGKIDGEKMLLRLRETGCLTEESRTEMHAK